MSNTSKSSQASSKSVRDRGGWRVVRVPRQVIDSVLLVAGLVIIGFASDQFTLSLLTTYVALAFMAVGLDLIWGYTGILSFGQAAFLGVGAYGMALAAARWDFVSTPIAVCVGILLAAGLALFLGWFVFYSKVGVFFIAVITLAVGVALEQAVNQFSTFTGGLNGILIEATFPWPQTKTYFLVVLLFAVMLGIMVRLVRSDFGQVLVAIRDNEERARFLGFATPWVKTIVFVLAAGLSAMGGVLYVLQSGLVSPTLIGFALSTQVVIWTAIGGRGTLVGPAVGTIAINYGQQELSGLFLASWQLALGAILVLVVAFAPEGLYAQFVTLTQRGSGDRDLGRRILSSKGRVVHDGSPDDLVLSLHAVSQNFGSFRALTNVSFVMARGELIGLIGPNGAGKSTLVDVVAGRREPSSGDVMLLGDEATGHRPEQIARSGLVRTFQAGTVFNSVSVFDNLFLAARKGRLNFRDSLRRRTTLELPTHIVDLLAKSGLDRSLDIKAGELAHGDRKWLEMCMVLAQEPSVVLLDEPTAGLTQPERREIGEALRMLASKHGLSLLLIEHDLEFVRQIADRIIVLDQGSIALDGDTADVIASPLVQEIYLGTP